MAQAPWPEYRVVARNIASKSENKIHSDEVARSLGFKGALISGVAVYSYMTRPLMERYGDSWLGGGGAEVRFFKPAYDGDAVTIRVEDTDRGNTVAVSASNAAGETLAAMTAQRRVDAPLAHTGGLEFVAVPQGAERMPMSWETLRLQQPLWTFPWRPALADNSAWAENVMDDLPLYRAGAAPPLHPGYVLRAANMTLAHQFILPAWIHVSSQVKTRAILRAGDQIDVHAVPVEKFDKRGNQYAVVNMRIAAAGATAVEVRHTFIFQVRKAA